VSYKGSSPFEKVYVNKVKFLIPTIFSENPISNKPSFDNFFIDAIGLLLPTTVFNCAYVNKSESSGNYLKYSKIAKRAVLS